jgi:hypothetical protein
MAAKATRFVDEALEREQRILQTRIEIVSPLAHIYFRELVLIRIHEP